MGQEQSSGRIPGVISALGKFLKGLKDYNVFELLKVLFALACVTFMVMLVMKPELIFEQVDKVIERVSQAREDRHADGTAFRLRADGNMRGELTGLLQSTGADRAFVMEFHNGSSNLSSGLPFLYLDLTIEVGAEGEPPLREGEVQGPAHRTVPAHLPPAAAGLLLRDNRRGQGAGLPSLLPPRRARCLAGRRHDPLERPERHGLPLPHLARRPPDGSREDRARHKGQRHEDSRRARPPRPAPRGDMKKPRPLAEPRRVKYCFLKCFTNIAIL